MTPDDFTGHTQGPWRAVTDFDGRHQHIPVMADSSDFEQDNAPYHPLIAVVYHGRGHAPRKIAEQTARLIAAAPRLLAERDAAREHVAELREALLKLANAADSVGVTHFDSDDLSPEVSAMQDATTTARAILARTRG